MDPEMEDDRSVSHDTDSSSVIDSEAHFDNLDNPAAVGHDDVVLIHAIQRARAARSGQDNDASSKSTNGSNTTGDSKSTGGSSVKATNSKRAKRGSAVSLSSASTNGNNKAASKKGKKTAQSGKNERSAKDEGEYIVDYITGKRIEKDGIVKYKVKWRGYSLAQCTWEPVENLDKCPEYIAQYEAELAEKQEAKKRKSEKPVAASSSKKAKSEDKPEVEAADQPEEAAKRASVIVIDGAGTSQETEAEPKVQKRETRAPKKVDNIVKSLASNRARNSTKSAASSVERPQPEAAKPAPTIAKKKSVTRPHTSHSVAPKKSIAAVPRTSVSPAKSSVQRHEASKASGSSWTASGAASSYVVDEDRRLELQNLKESAVKVVGHAVKDKEPYVLIHFKKGEENFMRCYPLKMAREFVPELLLDNLEELALKTALKVAPE